jgi:UDP-N-acetylglucosamine--N-acetylmuramyl-(pentapeptide) pyrophosphoryl-undecaprenol N-acetylglucosamine transferase
MNEPISRPNGRVFAVIAGGGSGGHVLPGLAIAEALVALGHDRDDVVFMGSARGMETSLIPPTGFALVAFPLVSFPRKLSLQHPKAALKLVAALAGAVRQFGRSKPKVVVSVGGYASMPGVVAAIVRRVPIVVVSYDAYAGMASRLAARFAKACAVGFEHINLPNKVLTGAPMRKEILAVDVDRDRVAARAALDIPADRFVLLVVGGSQGSGAINGVVDEFCAANAARTDLAVRHVLGARFLGDRTSRCVTDALWYQALGFEDRMPLAYAAADVVLARSGATTVAELAVLGVPSILVPWPASAEDHQTANARSLSEPGGAVLITESAFTADRLSAELMRLTDPITRAAMATAARALGRRDAADRIARLVEDCAAS